MTLHERFESKFFVHPITDCWLWIGSDNYRYGTFWMDKPLKAHRVAWTIYRGEIPNGLHVLHTCDTPLCVNPSHLFLGTHRDNMRDMFSKGRRDTARGFRNGNAKLTDLQVHEIRSSVGSQRKIAARFKISQTTVGVIKRRKNWKHI